MSILDLLVEKRIIDPLDLPKIREEMRVQNGNLEAVLEKRGIRSEDLLVAKGEFYGIPVRHLESQKVSFEILKYIPQESAEHYKIVPIGLADGILEVGLTDPDNIEARDALNFISARVSLPYKIFLITEADFTGVFETYRGLSGEVTQALSELESDLSKPERTGAGGAEILKDEEETPQSLIKNVGDIKTTTRIIEDAPVAKIVDTIISYATQGDASDVHVEHMEERVRVRFRVDGVLNTSLLLPLKVHSAIIARIKILCNMRLDEKRKPQDGRFSAKIEGRRIDFRVSTFPSYYGEKIVMRILDPHRGVKPLAEMGLSERNLKLIQDAINHPYGLILISGPTGSGKSTTLYAMLQEIDRETQNVLSLEDPVEYNIEGVSQSQVRPEIGYTFANGLRTTLRQDPDIIMVGEIRDKETAQLAVQAALTGHLVLSTIHTNTAAGVIPRLLDMGVDPYLIAPTLIVAIAQRLVKTLCPGGGKSVPIDGSIKRIIEREFADLPERFRTGIVFPDAVYEAEATSECPKGTSGRTAVFEVLSMNRELEKVILENPVDSEIKKIARAQGMLTMKEDAFLKAFRREIPLAEVNKL